MNHCTKFCIAATLVLGTTGSACAWHHRCRTCVVGSFAPGAVQTSMAPMMTYAVPTQTFSVQMAAPAMPYVAAQAATPFFQISLAPQQQPDQGQVNANAQGLLQLGGAGNGGGQQGLLPDAALNLLCGLCRQRQNQNPPNQGNSAGGGNAAGADDLAKISQGLADLESKINTRLDGLDKSVTKLTDDQAKISSILKGMSKKIDIIHKKAVDAKPAGTGS